MTASSKGAPPDEVAAAARNGVVGGDDERLFKAVMKAFGSKHS